MSGKQLGKDYNRRKRLNPIRLWINRNCLPANYWERQFRVIGDIYRDDWRAWSHELDNALTWAAYRVAVIGFSLAGTTYGIGQLIGKMLGG